jgi:hypothetical protein
MPARAPERDVKVLAWLPPAQRDPEFPSATRRAAFAEALRHQGIRGAFWLHEPAGEGVVAALHAQLGLAVNPVVPNMRAYLRDASEHGVVGAALQRFRRLRPADQLSIALHQARQSPRVLARDFATGVLVMVEMELARFRRLAPQYAVLNASVTDLALALDHDRLLRDFVRLAARTYGLKATLGTYNYGILCERLTIWRIRPDAILAPFNPRGYLMNPSKEDCERALKGSDVEVLASHIDVDGIVERREALAYLTGLSIRRGVVDILP